MPARVAAPLTRQYRRRGRSCIDDIEHLWIVRESVFLEGLATDVVTTGTFAYAADRPTGFYVFDLSKRMPLEPIGSLQSAVPNNTQRAQLEVIENAGGRRIVVLVAGGLLQLFDVSMPNAPVKLPPFKTPGNANRIAMKA